jgi:hypothetical protein
MSELLLPLTRTYLLTLSSAAPTVHPARGTESSEQVTRAYSVRKVRALHRAFPLDRTMRGGGEKKQVPFSVSFADIMQRHETLKFVRVLGMFCRPYESTVNLASLGLLKHLGYQLLGVTPLVNI